MDGVMTTAMMLILMVTLIPMVGILMAITPYLMKKSECFTVTVPETALRDPYLKGLKKRYLAEVLLATALLTAAGFLVSFLGNQLLTIVLLTVGTLFLVVFSYGLMLRNRSKVRIYKKEQNWHAVQQEAVALTTGESAPRALSLKWNLLYLPVIALTLLVGFLGYASIPEQVPVHMGFDGQVSTVEKSLSLILMPALIQAFLALCFFFCHWMIIRSKRSSNPNAPATSALAYGMFAKAQTLYLLALGMILCVLMALMTFSFMGVVTLMQAGISLMVGALAAIVGALAIAVVYGQGGSRVFARMQESEAIPADEDRFWKLGIFYVNREDPSLFLLERFGVGWTVNFARPAVWVILGLFVLLTVAFVVLMLLLS
ncbi:MAG: DUF1648 domain-containing protein [Coriobacteriales bacterium]|jgi:uncharacterized membrane protein|nr:DUF1648 domain-containing protein [Coriobacteriales bacterium]